MSVQQEEVGQKCPQTATLPQSGRIASFLEENGTVVLVVAAFAVVLITHLRASLLSDGWMALLSGREVAQHGLPSHDTLTVWSHGHSWVDQEWLAQLTLYELQRLGGLRLVMLVHALLATAGLAGAAFLARRVGGSARSVTWVCVLVLVAFWPGASVMRPQSFAYVLFVLVLWLLLDDLRTPSRRVYLVFPVLVLWANLHGSVGVAAALVSGYALLELISSLHARPRTIRGRSVLLLVVPWLCILASPYATALPGYYRRILFANGFGKYVTEWAPTSLKPESVPIFLLVLGGFWLLGRSGKAVSAFEKLAFVFVTLLAFDAVRNWVWLALLSLVVLPRLLDALRGAVVEPARLNRLLALAMIVGVIVATAAVATKQRSWFTQSYPTAAADAAAKAAGPNGKIFANEAYSDWLIWTHPELAGRVAYDTRFELLTQRQLAAAVDFFNRVDGWTATVRGYDVFVLNGQDNGKVRTALLRQRIARPIVTSGNVVVLRRIP